MSQPNLLQRGFRYGAVGVIAAGVHTGTLLALALMLPLWLANPLAFLAASVAGYLGHALVTFREETGGARFARRWLLLQYAVNLSVCALLPLVLQDWAPPPARTLVLVFTPTVLNALIWSRAARFSARQRHESGPAPQLHADDLGLADGVNAAILNLARNGNLQSASLLVDGPSVASGLSAWRDLDPPLPLCLHLCLTEGPVQPASPDLPTGFGTLLLASVLPWRRRSITPQLDRAIAHQIQKYKTLTGLTSIQVDGHQHIHLVPLVLDRLLDLAPRYGITWIRTTCEPLPSGLPLRHWLDAIRSGGLVKWLVLQLLSQRARPRLRRAGIRTNGLFGGVLFTGRMSGTPLTAIHRDLSRSSSDPWYSRNLLLAHPAAPGSATALSQHGFHLSALFFASGERQQEWKALEALKDA